MGITADRSAATRIGPSIHGGHVVNVDWLGVLKGVFYRALGHRWIRVGMCLQNVRRDDLHEVVRRGSFCRLKAPFSAERTPQLDVCCHGAIPPNRWRYPEGGTIDGTRSSMLLSVTQRGFPVAASGYTSERRTAISFITVV